MKKLICTLLAICLVASFAGCSINITAPGTDSNSSSAGAGKTSDAVSVIESTPDISLPEISSDVSSEASEPVTSAVESTPDVSSTAPSVQTGNTFKYFGLSIELPEGFSVSDPNANTPIAMHSSYPTVSDNITFSKSGASSSSTYTEELIKQTYSSVFDGFNLLSYKKVTVAGLEAIEINYKVTMSGTSIEQIQDMIFANDATYIITYTIVSETYRSAFKNSLSTVTVTAM